MNESFIHQQYLSDISICDDLIAQHKNSNLKYAGTVGAQLVDKEQKDSTDIALENGDVAFRYLTQLQEVIDAYMEKFPYCNAYGAWSFFEPINIQHYHAGGGFKKFHTERADGTFPKALRHLVFMTYLNDVTDEGGTEFFHQKLITQARKGLTLVWPADWTHTHRGIVSPSQEKYVITGWYSFMPIQSNIPISETKKEETNETATAN